jgi:hypothetical protein
VAESFIHLHPDVRARKLDVLKIECESSSARVIIEPFGAESVEVITGADEPAQAGTSRTSALPGRARRSVCGLR